MAKLMSSFWLILMVSLLLSNAQVKPIDEIRRDNLSLLEIEAGSLKKLAEKLGKDDSQVSQWKNGTKNSGTGKPRGMRNTTLREIEHKCGKDEGWMDIDHSNMVGEDTSAQDRYIAAARNRIVHANSAPAWYDLVIVLGATLLQTDARDQNLVRAVLQDVMANPSEAQHYALRLAGALAPTKAEAPLGAPIAPEHLAELEKLQQEAEDHATGKQPDKQRRRISH